MPSANDILLKIERSQGVPENKLSLIPNAQAAQRVLEIKQLPIDEQIQVIQNIGATFGKNAPIALRDLQNAGLPFATGIALAAATNTLSQGDMPAIIATYSATAKEAKETQGLAFDKWTAKEGIPVTSADVKNQVETLLQPYLASLDGTNGTDTTTQTKVVNESLRLAYQFGSTGMGRVQALQQATNDVVNNNYNFASQHGFAPLRVAKNQDANDIRASITPLITIADNQQLTIPVKFQTGLPATWQQNYKDALASGGHLISNPQTNGVILVDSGNQPVLDANGNRIQASYAEINDPTSDVGVMMSANPVPHFLLTSAPRFAIRGLQAIAPIAITRTKLELQATKRQINNFIANLPPDQLAAQDAAFKKLQAALDKR